MASSISFQGLSTNLPTDQLVSAIINQQSQPMQRMQKQQTLNDQKSAALATLRADLKSLASSLTSLADTGFLGDTVSSSDSTNAYVTATAKGAAAGTYDIQVKTLATRARTILPTSMAATATVGAGAYVVTDMDGKTWTYNASASDTLETLAANLNNLKDGDGKAIPVTASVVKTGTDGTAQLVLSSRNTGTSAADPNAKTFRFDVAAGSALADGATTQFTSSEAVNSEFYVNGVLITRTSNAVSDAVEGVTFNLAKADEGKTTTLTVALDTGAATAALQDVVTKFNTFVNDYKSRSGYTKNSDGSITPGLFNMDSTIRGVVQKVADTLMRTPTGLAAGATYTSPASVGLATNRDGTLSLNTTTFKEALEKDAVSVSNLFRNSGRTSDSRLLYLGMAPETIAPTSGIAYRITYSAGTYTGEFDTQDANGVPQTVTLSNTDGLFVGTAGTPLQGLTLQANGASTGTLYLNRGASAAVSDLIQDITGNDPSDLGGQIDFLTLQNRTLQTRIDQQQAWLDRSKANLEKLYAALETTVGQLQAAGQSLGSL